MSNIWWKNTPIASFSQAAERFRNGTSTPRDYLEQCLEAINKSEPGVKAFTAIDVDFARQQADAAGERYQKQAALSSLDGCPVGIKDTIDTSDFPTTYGSRIFADHNPRFDAACVQLLKAHGAVLVGKTVTTEMAMGSSGPTVNPRKEGHTPGGSSSGSAAAVAAGMLPVALGSQTQGSVIRPASYCGVVGYKPTWGLMPTGGVHPVSATHDHLGVLGATIEDCWVTATLLSANRNRAGMELDLLPDTGTAGRTAPPRRLVRLYLNAWESEVADDVKSALDNYVAHLREQGIQIIDKHNNEQVAELEALFAAYGEDSMDIVAHEMHWPFGQYREQYREMLSPRILELLERGERIDAQTYDRLLHRRDHARAMVRAIAAQTDGFLTLAASGTAPAGLEYTGSRSFPAVWTWLGFPAFTLPLLAVDGMPVGVQVMHRDYQDSALFRAAYWLSQDAQRHI